MDIFPCNAFYDYITNLTAKQVSLPNSMKVPYASNAPACIIHARDDDPYILKLREKF